MTGQRRVGIAGVGTYLPDRVITNRELEQRLDTTDAWIRSRTGIGQRYVAAPEQAASDLGLPAAQRALAQAGIGIEAIDRIYVATSSPDSVFPSTACRLQHLLGAPEIGACDINVVCSGFAFALTMGYLAVRTGTAERVLVVAAEKFSSLLDWEDRSTAVLMGDGAGAVVLGADAPRGEILANILGTDSSGIEELWIPAGGSVRPASHATVDGRLHFMKMNGPEIYKFGCRIIGEALEQALAAAGLGIADMDLLIPHQANIRILQSASKRLNLPMEKIVCNIDRYSNTSAASIPIALAEAQAQGRLQPGMIVGLVAFGSGLSWGASILRW